MNNQDIDKVIMDADQLLKSKETLFQDIDQKLNQDFSSLNSEQLEQFQNELMDYSSQLPKLSNQIGDVKIRIYDFISPYSNKKITSGSTLFERMSRSQSYQDKQNQKSSLIEKLKSLDKQLGIAYSQIIPKGNEISSKISQISRLLKPISSTSSSPSSSSSSSSSSTSSSKPKSYGYTQDQRRRFGGKYKISKKNKKNTKSKRKLTKKQRNRRSRK
jgi:hypothetical protein